MSGRSSLCLLRLRPKKGAVQRRFARHRPFQFKYSVSGEAHLIPFQDFVKLAGRPERALPLISERLAPGIRESHGDDRVVL